MSSIECVIYRQDVECDGLGMCIKIILGRGGEHHSLTGGKSDTHMLQRDLPKAHRRHLNVSKEAKIAEEINHVVLAFHII